MALETTATYIDSLVITDPVGATDLPILGDEHLRLIKAALRRTFSGIAGAVTPTAAQLNDIPNGMQRNVNLRVSATHSYSAAPKFAMGGGDYAMGGHLGCMVNTSGTAVTTLFTGWSSSLSGGVYTVRFPGPASASDLRACARVTPAGPSMRASGVALNVSTQQYVVSYVLIGADGAFTYGPSSVLLNTW